MFVRGQIVFGKMRTFPYWPAVIIDEKDCKRHSTAKNHLWVLFLGDHQIAQVDKRYIVDFKLAFKEKWNPKLSQRYKQSVHEGLVILASRHDVATSDPSAMMKWALNGFPTRLRLRNEGLDAFGLPDIAVKSLKKIAKNCNESSKGKSAKDGENKKDKDREYLQGKVVRDVRKQRKLLEDVCIICLTEEEVVILHPIFQGGSCQKCKKSVVKIVKCARGVPHDFCILCGEGGELFYCCNPDCQSALCDVCIDFMTPKGTLSKIKKNRKWECYLCKPDHAKGNLIQRRETRFFWPKSPPTEEEKLPIRVLSLNDKACTALKMKKVLIELFCIEPKRCIKAGSSKQDMYDDFTKEEILEMKPDFIYGSFIIPATGVVRKNSEEFFETVYKFISRLLSAQKAFPKIFFMFMTDEILDAEMKLRVTRFLERDPVTIKLPSKEICLWTNIPEFKGIKDQKCSMKIKTAIEEGILKKFLEPLKAFFKQEK